MQIEQSVTKWSILLIYDVTFWSQCKEIIQEKGELGYFYQQLQFQTTISQRTNLHKK
jgi:hypothetical protein